MAAGVLGRQIDHEADGRDRFIGQQPDTEPADFKHPGQRRGWADQQAAGMRFDVQPVVADQPSVLVTWLSIWRTPS